MWHEEAKGEAKSSRNPWKNLISSHRSQRERTRNEKPLKRNLWVTERSCAVSPSLPTEVNWSSITFSVRSFHHKPSCVFFTEASLHTENNLPLLSKLQTQNVNSVHVEMNVQCPVKITLNCTTHSTQYFCLFNLRHMFICFWCYRLHSCWFRMHINGWRLNYLKICNAVV